MSTTEESIVSLPASTPEVTPIAAPSPAPVPAVDAKPITRRESVERAFREPSKRSEFAASRDRTPQGQFVPKPQVPQTSIVAAVTNPAPIPAVNVTRPPLLQGLKAEHAPLWDKADPALLSAVAERYADWEKGLEPLKTAKTQYEDLMSAFQPYQQLMASENLSPKQAASELMQMAAIVRVGSPLQKAQTVAGILHKFGIPIEHVQQVLSTPPPPQEVANPQVQQLSQQVQQLTAHLNQQSVAAAQTIANEFGANPANKHFAAVRSQMGALLEKPDILGPEAASMSERDLLKAAYDYACWTNPMIRPLMLAEQQQAAVPAAQVAQIQKAAVSVHGAPSAGPAARPNPKDRRAVIANAIAAATR
jgi:hypothetical protein